MSSSHPPEKTGSQSGPPTNIIDHAIIALGKVVSLFFVFSAVIIFGEIVARYVFNSPTFWVHETTIFVGALLFVFGGSYCVARDKHIRIVILYDYVSARMRRRLDILISTLCLISTGTLSWAAWQVLERAIFTPQGAFRMETSGSAWNPPFPAIIKGFLFMMLCIMTLQFFLHLLHHIRRTPND